MIEQASLVIGGGNWAVKSDSLLGYKTIDGKYYPREMSVVRATTGTRINEDGLVELVPYNLLSYSEEMSTSPWALVRSTVNTNATTAPNGTLTADELIANVTGSNGSWARQTISAINGSFNLSVYAKQGTSPFLLVYLDLLGGVIFDLSNGTIKSSSAGIVGVITTDVNGWYKCSISGTATGQTLALFIVGNASMNLSTWFSTNGDSVYLWGAQLVEGSVGKDYLPTTDRLDVARIDYSTGEPALLLEPQRTNLLTYSSSFDNAAWTKLNATVTANYGISPDGTQNADRIQFTTSNSSSIYRAIGGATTDANTIYVKGVSGEKVLFGYGGNVASGTLYTLNGDWQRLEQISTIGSVFHIGNYYLGDATDILIWGAQREAGSNATSYIPTTSASVTRNADQVFKTGISSLIGQTEGTIYWEGEKISNANFGIALVIDNGTGERIYLLSDAIGFRVDITSGGGSSAFYSGTQGIGTYKIAIGYSSAGVVVYINGVSVFSDLSVTIPACQNLYLSNWASYTEAVKTSQALLFKTRLTNDELATLTTI